MSRFFIERPIFANVIAIITMIVGAIAMVRLPVEQYPEITPPTIRVTASYPGANAQVVSDTVASTIEQEVNGVENMLYMSSTCSSNGAYTLTVSFEIGTDLDDAQVMVQNRIAQAESRLPEEVRRQGVTVKKQSTNITLLATLTSTDDRYDGLFLSNYAALHIRDQLSRVPGVGDINIFGGSNYSMRIWLDPEKLKARNLTTQDVSAAIREQNAQIAPGQVGQPPVPGGLGFQYIVTSTGRLSEVSEFENIVVKSSDDGRRTYLRDIATVELGALSYDQYSLLKGKPCASLAVYQLPGSNAIDVTEGVREAISRLEGAFPEAMQVEYPLDSTKFVRASIDNVKKTLIEAGILVLIVILVFLQDWRAVLIPATTVPVTIIGAFMAMAFLGFSINTLTLFGLVLAIGIVVDDAIVIVENAAHHIELGLPPKEATIKAMDEVLGPIIGITLVLMAVFIPSAFLGGITGELYRQFALTIAATALLSAINAVTLKPAQCALWLRPVNPKKNWFYRGFNKVYFWFEAWYVSVVRLTLKTKTLMTLIFIGLVVFTGWLYTRVPTGFLPNEDQGYALVMIQLPDAASLERTRGVIDQVNSILENTPGVEYYFGIAGFSFADNSVAPNGSTFFVMFDDWSQRNTPELSIQGILKHITQEVNKIEEARIFAVAPPPIRGLGVRSGFSMQIEDRGDVGMSELQQAIQRLIEVASQQKNPVTDTPYLNMQYSTFRAGVPQINIDIDEVKVKNLGLSMNDVRSTLQTYMGSEYINDFNKYGRVFQVRVQADQKFRLTPESIQRLEVRNDRGQMIPLGTVADVQRTFGPNVINRYNLYPSAPVNGEPAQGLSSGEALAIMEKIAEAELPRSMGYSWTGVSFQEKRVSGEAVVIFAFAVLLVYLVLAAQYESWYLPWAVILVVPLGLLGAIGLVQLRGMDNNVYTQIGIVLIIALASKNAILIVEFARELRLQGKSIYEAAVEGARLRFRPILMTSFAFILGITPLLFAKGAGASGQQALGTAVFGGMLAATFLAVLFVPLFFVLFQSFSEWRRPILSFKSPHPISPVTSSEVVAAEVTSPEGVSVTSTNLVEKRDQPSHPA